MPTAVLHGRDLHLALVQGRAHHGVADVLGVRLDVDGLSIGAAEHDAVSGGAGRRVISTFLPVCSPTPVARIEFFSVR